MILPIKQHLRPRYTLYNLSRGLEFAVDALIGFLFVSGALAMFVMVVTRYGFSWSDPSIEILVRYSMIWGTFVGVAAAVRFGVNIRFTMLEKLLKDVLKAFAVNLYQKINIIVILLTIIPMIVQGSF